MLDWNKETANKNYCGYCIDYTCTCNSMCFNENHLGLDYKKNREDHIAQEVIKTKKRLYDLMFDRGDWASMHDVVYDLAKVSLKQEGLESIFDQLPDDIQFDAFKWGLSDTEVSGSIHKYLKDNEISFK